MLKVAPLTENTEAQAASRQPQQLAWLKTRNPQAFEETKEAAQNGKWEPGGSMWVEPDCSIPSGESLVRQILHGKNFLRDELGVEAAFIRIPDACGVSAALPQIMAKTGVSQFVGGFSQNFPHDAFWWEGIDGTRVFSRSIRAHADSTSDGRDLPVWRGELPGNRNVNPTAPARSQKGNRKSEELLRNAEFYDAAAMGGYEVEPNVGEGNRAEHDVIGKNASTPAAYLDRAWKLLLLNQSSNRAAAEDSARDYAKIAMLARAVLEPARASIVSRIDTSGAAKPLIIFNTASFTRSEIVSLPDGAPLHVEVPPCGYAVVDADERRPVASFAAPVEVFERRRILALDNGMLRIIFNRDGNLDSIKDHRANREVLAPNQRGNVFQIHGETNQELGGVEKLEVIESTPLRATVRTVRRFGNGSSITQRVSLCAGSARIDFDTEVDWSAEAGILKVAFPVNIHSARATFEIPYGHAERPTFSNPGQDSAKVAALTWADFSEPDYGVALLNDCKLGCEIFGNVMRLSLLRASAEASGNADRGHHHFTYSLLPHAGDLRAGRMIQTARALNVPLQVVSSDSHRGELPETQSFFAVDRPGVIIETVKRAEKENAIIVRLCETYGTRGSVTLTTSLPLDQAFAADLMERTLTPLKLAGKNIALSISPFEIVTLKFPLA